MNFKAALEEWSKHPQTPFRICPWLAYQVAAGFCPLLSLFGYLEVPHNWSMVWPSLSSVMLDHYLSNQTCDLSALKTFHCFCKATSICVVTQWESLTHWVIHFHLGPRCCDICGNLIGGELPSHCKNLREDKNTGSGNGPKLVNLHRVLKSKL